MLPALLWLALAAAPTAATQAKAQALTRRSIVEYDAGDFEHALADSTQAFELVPLPPLLFNLAQCHRALHHWEQAEFFYHRYLSRSPGAKNRRTVEVLIVAMRARQGRPPDQALPELEATPLVPPSVPAAEGDRLAASANPGLLREAEPLPAVVVVGADAPRSSKGWALGLTGTAVALGALGLGAAIVSQANRAAASSMARPLAPSEEAILSQRSDRAQGFGLAADLLWGGAGAAAIGAGVLFGLAAHGHDGPPAGVTLGPGPGALGLSLASPF